MGRQPAAIVIARHGARLDQADKNWQNTAASPYDTPLSYGGWIQCQTLGARIGKELESLDIQTTAEDLNREEQGLDVQRPTKRRKVIIHSSPYLRCIQTSVAIAAGLRYPQVDRFRPFPTPYQRSSLSKPPLLQNSSGPTSAPTSAPTSQPSPNASANEVQPEKIALKIDPYLGEWLSPSYFENMQHPPRSEEMLDRAKQALKAPAEDIKGAEIAPPSPIDEDSESKGVEIPVPQEKGGLRGMAVAGHSLPHRTRTTSFGKDFTSNTAKLPLEAIRRRSRANSYTPPLPTYSLAPQDPIPPGYVAHARDACIEPELTWDSTALGWGDGGEYGEEWSAMHKRFRNGLQLMLGHYDDDFSLAALEEEEGEETDIVLVLVTHQAGANALIRLLTGAPALHDIGVGSLTFAVRRPTLRRLPSLEHVSHSPLGYGRLSRKTSRRGSLDLGLADDFEMKIIASTEHLRAGSNPLGLNSPRLGKSPAMAGRRLVGPDSPDGFSIGDPLAWRSSSASSLGRSTSQRSHAADSGGRPRGTTGLWGSPTIASQTPIDENMEPADTPMSPRSGPILPEPMWKPDGDIPEIQSLNRSNTVTSSGLWGGGGNVGDRRTSTSRDSSFRSVPRRSWTVAEN